MPEYQAPIADMKFVLRELVDMELLAQLLDKLRQTVIENGNTFEVLMQAVRGCSLGQITRTLYDVGGRYRRNM